MAATEVAPADRLGAAFAAGRDEGRALVMPFLMAGYPDAGTFLEAGRVAAAGGADVFEVGIPFSDPIMDGPVIAAAADAVLRGGQRVADAIELIARLVGETGRPAVAMTYYNLIYRYGVDRFARALADAGACGAIVPDLSVEDADQWRAACAAAGIAPVFMAAQTSPPERLERIGAASGGFVYAASLLGVTGVREQLAGQARALVARVRDACDLPVAVGIGVSTPEHAREVAGYADGVIVGSAIVRRLSEPGGAAAVESFVASLRAAVEASATDRQRARG